MSVRQRARLLVMALALSMSLVVVPGTATATPAAPSTFANQPAEGFNIAYRLPFPCGQKWRLDTWAHAPALDMVREPDQRGTEGSQIVAPAAGVVNQSFYHSQAGNVIQINHGSGFFTTYLHLQSRAVNVGDSVQLGQLIGLVGRTGPTANNRPHLHVEQAYDRNRDGKAEWGYIKNNNEITVQNFDGVTYGQKNGMTWRNVTSGNSCGSGPGPGPQEYLVDTFEDAPGHSTPGGTRTGTLYKGTHYVFCKVQGPNKQVGDDYNHWWLKTDLDTGQRNQWVSAYHLARWGNNEARDNNGREIPNC